MSIVERAADKLRQTDPDTQDASPRQADAATVAPEQRIRDHVAAAGRQHIGASSTPTTSAPAQAEPRTRLAVDFKKLRRAGLLPAVAAEAMVAREYQRIKRPLLANANGHANGHANGGMQAPGMADANRFMVASAIPGEGKTFTSFNLALSLAKERDYSVILIDGDVIKPSISRALGLGDSQGLTDILADDSIAFNDTVIQTNVPRLSVMPAGQRHDEATELIASHRMNWLMNELGRDPNRMILFDSSPLLATAEAQALAMAVGQILLVVKAGSTGRAAVESALSLVAAPDKSVSLILNQSRKAYGDYYAGYYGGYYDGHETGV